MNETVSSTEENASTPAKTVRRFRPRWWAALLALSFAVLTIYLGHWQGGRAQYKIDQQTTLDNALAASPVDFWRGPKTTDEVTPLRYRAINVNGEFDAKKMFFVDNRIQDGKAGYVVLQLLRAEQNGTTRYVLVDRGWVEAAQNRSQLPVLDTPADRASIVGRINLPQSRNPGTQDNAAHPTDPRINYINLEELAQRLGVALEPYVIEQTAGPGFLGTQRALPAANYQKNRMYQMQWYAFAAFAVVLFFVLSVRKEVVS